ncbi:MAG TPA: hypothetical protein VKA08_16535 [Balneolales bacterium]|nr:hypothetical protein [Balneolales bacterium]
MTERTANISRYIFLLLMLLPLETYGQLHIPHVTANGYIKELGMLQVDNSFKTFHYDNLVHNRVNFQWKPNTSFQINAAERTRLFNGYTVRHTPGYGSIISQDQGLVDLSWNWVDTKQTILNTSIDRLYATWYSGKWEIDVGRQRINWGKTYVWNPNDLFNAYSYLDFDYEEKPGADAIRLQYFSGFASGYEFAFKPDRRDVKQSVGAFLVRTHKGLYDLQFLGGYYHDQAVLGGGWAGSIGQAGFKGEFSVYHPLYSHPAKNFYMLLSTSGDYAFSSGLYISGEFLYNGNAPSKLNPQALFGETLQANNLFITRTAGFAQVTFPLTPLLNVGLSGIEGFSNRLTIIIPQITYSVTEDIDFLLLAQVIRNKAIEQIYPTPNLFYARLRWSF